LLANDGWIWRWAAAKSGNAILSSDILAVEPIVLDICVGAAVQSLKTGVLKVHAKVVKWCDADDEVLGDLCS
jgi:hypothetical protein